MKGNHTKTRVIVGSDYTAMARSEKARLSMLLARLQLAMAGGTYFTYGLTMPNARDVYLMIDRSGREFPYTSTYVAAVGPITVSSWQEEFIVFMAHELQHISQYQRHGKFMQRTLGHNRSEYLAERQAKRVLGEYRRELPTFYRGRLFVRGTVTGTRSWESIEAEIAKCDIVCSNCHRIRTAKSLGWLRDLEK